MISQIHIDRWKKLWTPPEKLTLSEWAENNFRLSPEYSARTGGVILYGWQKGILDSFTDQRVEKITLMCGTQLVKTIFIQIALAYCIAEDPGPILVVQPKEPDAETFSKERLGPMIRDIPVLRERFISRLRDSSNTILSKLFPNGSITLVGAIAPGNLARRSIRYLFFDEVDKYPANAGGEGDPINLGIERTVTFGTRKKIILACSPTIAGRSRIETSFLEGDQRRPWVPCPLCGEMQILEWANVTYSEKIGPSSARYRCKACSQLWNDTQRWSACSKAVWRAEKPFNGHASFWISHLYSPWKKLSDIVSSFFAAKASKEQLQVFVNTSLAETYKEQGERPDWLAVKGRAERYEYGENLVIPHQISFLTAAVDVQNDRLEVELVGWARGKSSWSLDYFVIRAEDGHGNPLQSTDKALWDKLGEYLNRSWKHESGASLPIMVMTIDTGNRPTPVYNFSRLHAKPGYGPVGIKINSSRTVVPIKGSNKESLKIIAGVSKEDAARKRQNVRIVSVGVSCLKQQIYDALRLSPNDDGSFPDGYIHNPLYGDVYFQGLCSEVRIIHNDGSVTWQREFARNEPLDLKVYNRAAAAIFGMDHFTEGHWKRIDREFGISVLSVPDVVVNAIVEVEKPTETMQTQVQNDIKEREEKVLDPILRPRRARQVSAPVFYGRETY